MMAYHLLEEDASRAPPSPRVAYHRMQPDPPSGYLVMTCDLSLERSGRSLWTRDEGSFDPLASFLGGHAYEACTDTILLVSGHGCDRRFPEISAQATTTRRYAEFR